MIVTRQTVALQLAAYLRHELTLPQLVDWAEDALMESEFDEEDAALLARVVGRLGVADLRAFGLGDCEDLLHVLGYHARVEVVAA